MSLSIDTEKLVAVYALGEWHKIKPGSVVIDAYELMHYLDSAETRESCSGDGRGHAVDFYEMGKLYQGIEPKFERCWMNQGSGQRPETMHTPSGAAGFSFTTPKETKKAFSLMECRAFEYQKEID